jgi:hypothetical protein
MNRPGLTFLLLASLTLLGGSAFSQITANATWVINNVVTWKSRLYFFTSYKRTEAEWENTFELKVSKYITANIFLFPRFDDSSKTRDEDLGFFQFKEYSSLGFAYNF